MSNIEVYKSAYGRIKIRAGHHQKCVVQEPCDECGCRIGIERHEWDDEGNARTWCLACWERDRDGESLADERQYLVPYVAHAWQALAEMLFPAV